MATARVQTTARDLGCQCSSAELVPFAKLDRKDPVLRSYLAPPAAPNINAVSPQRAIARREAAGVALATFLFLCLVLTISLGVNILVVVFAAIGAVLTRAIVWQTRVKGILAEERTLAEQAQNQQEVYQARRAAWERLTYCPDCRVVIDQKTGDARPLHLAHELLVVSSIVPTSSTSS